MQCVERAAAQRIANIRVQKPGIAPFLPSEKTFFINAISAALGIAQASLALLSLARDFKTLRGLCICIGKGSDFQNSMQEDKTYFFT